VQYKAPQGSEKGGAYWDIGRVSKVVEGGSLVEFEDYEEVKGSRGQNSTFEHWRLTDDIFEAPVSELVILTCQENNDHITVEISQLDRIANDVEAKADRARRNGPP